MWDIILSSLFSNNIMNYNFFNIGDIKLLTNLKKCVIVARHWVPFVPSNKNAAFIAMNAACIQSSRQNQLDRKSKRI